MSLLPRDPLDGSVYELDEPEPEPPSQEDGSEKPSLAGNRSDRRKLARRIRSRDVLVS
jgi:hypothetical protein